MESVGQSGERNALAKSRWSRDRLLQSVVLDQSPTIFDVGAHRGESALLFQRLFDTPKIFSFEPDPDSFLALRSLQLENHILFNMALSDHSGTSLFYRNSISHTNSLFPVNLNSKDSISLSEHRKNNSTLAPGLYNQQIAIETSTLDVIAHSHAVDHISLLKVDVQGAEALVLSGARDLLPAIDCILLEVALFDYYDRSSSFFDIEQLLRPFDFQLYAITDISQNPMNGRTDWVEVLYLRNQS